MFSLRTKNKSIMFKFKKLRKTLDKEIKRRYEKLEKRYLGFEKNMYTTLEGRLATIESKFDELSDLLKEEIKARKVKNEEKSFDKEIITKKKEKVAKKKNSKKKEKKKEDKKDKIIQYSSDNLTKIKGLGEKFAEKLNKEGINSFQQLAELSEANLVLLDQKIKTIAARYNRYDWGKQAKELLA